MKVIAELKNGKASVKCICEGLKNCVFMLGSWDNWQSTKMKEIQLNNFYAEIWLKPGKYFFKFVLNNNLTYGDYEYQISENNEIYNVLEDHCFCDEKGMSHFNWRGEATNLILMGSWNNWIETPMKKIENGFEYDIFLEPGRYEYRLKNDEEWYKGYSKNTCSNSYGTLNFVVHCFPHMNKTIMILPNEITIEENISPYIYFLEDNKCYISESFFEFLNFKQPSFNFEKIVLAGENIQSLKYFTFHQFQALDKIYVENKLKDFNQFHEEFKENLEFSMDNLFNGDYHHKSQKKICLKKTEEILSKIEMKMEIDEFLRYLRIKTYEIELYDQTNTHQDDTKDLCSFIFYRLFLIKNTMALKLEELNVNISFFQCNELLKKYFECLKKFLLEQNLKQNLHNFQKSILYVISRCFCDNLNNAMLSRATNLLSSFETVEDTDIYEKKEYKNHLFIYKSALRFFHYMVKTPKFVKALKIFINNLDLGYSSEKMEKKMNEIIEKLSKLNPILVKNIQVNGIISSEGTFYISQSFISDFSNVSKENLESLRQFQAARLSLVRLFTHEAAHVIIRLIMSENNFDFLLMTPPGLKQSNDFNDYEGGYQLENVFFGTCKHVIYGKNEHIDKFFQEKTWENDFLPIFSDEEKKEMDNIHKNFFFSGIEMDITQKYE